MACVTVVIPTVRGGQLLRDAVSSVEAQTLTDWELIVVADGCEDPLGDVGIGDERTRVVRQPRRGVSVARNVGILEASTTLVAFLDDDDRMLPNRLSRQVAAMADERFGLCHTRWRAIDARGEPLAEQPAWRSASEGDPQYLDLLRGAGVPPITTAVVRRSLLWEVGGFHSSMRHCEDFDLVYRIARERLLLLLNEVLVEYRRHDDPTHPYTQSSGGELAGILAAHLSWAEANGTREQVDAARSGLAMARRRYAGMLAERALEARRRGAGRDAVSLAGRSLATSPRGATASLLRSLARQGRRH